MRSLPLIVSPPVGGFTTGGEGVEPPHAAMDEVASRIHRWRTLVGYAPGRSDESVGRIGFTGGAHGAFLRLRASLRRIYRVFVDRHRSTTRSSSRARAGVRVHGAARVRAGSDRSHDAVRRAAGRPRSRAAWRVGAA